MSQDTDSPWKDESRLREKYCRERMTMAEIADEWGTTFDTVRYYKDKFDLSRQSAKERMDAERVERLYWEDGLSLNGVGEVYDTGGVTVLKFMQEVGIPRRTPDQDKGDAWKDADTLRELYWDEGMTLEEVGNRLGCAKKTVSNWMQRLDVDRRLTPEEKPAYYDTSAHGYERAKSKHNQRSYRVGIHQLVAIANGADPYKVFSGGEYNVHHKNGIPWDNRPENVELLTKSEHSSHHYKERVHGPDGDFTG